jgi:hypothetical protein
MGGALSFPEVMTTVFGLINAIPYVGIYLTHKIFGININPLIKLTFCGITFITFSLFYQLNTSKVDHKDRKLGNGVISILFGTHLGLLYTMNKYFD